jgi:hypothetical protein
VQRLDQRVETREGSVESSPAGARARRDRRSRAAGHDQREDHDARSDRPLEPREPSARPIACGSAWKCLRSDRLRRDHGDRQGRGAGARERARAAAEQLDEQARQLPEPRLLPDRRVGAAPSEGGRAPGRDHDDLRRRGDRADLANRIRRRSRGNVVVHDERVGSVGSREPDQLVAGRRLGDDDEAVLLEEEPEEAARYGQVIGDEDGSVPASRPISKLIAYHSPQLRSVRFHHRRGLGTNGH